MSFRGLLLALSYFALSSGNAGGYIPDHEAMSAAEYALRELRKTSDSGIYDTLSIARIYSSSKKDGIRHNNILLEMDLASPYFESGEPMQRVSVIVMEDKEDGVLSIAIDEFPKMSEDAIEEFWIKKVEAKRKEREAAFRRIEVEDILLREKGDLSEEEKEVLQQRFSSMSVEDLLDVIEKADDRATRVAASNVAVRSISPVYEEEDRRLYAMSLRELYLTSLGDVPGSSEYEIEKSRNILSDVLLTLSDEK